MSAMSDAPSHRPTGADWVARFATELGIDAPDERTVETLLDLAGAALLIGEGAGVYLPAFVTADGFERFRQKVQAFLRGQLNHVAIQRLRTNQPLTAVDLAELERMLLEAGKSERDLLEKAARESEGLGLFVRSLVGRTDRTSTLTVSFCARTNG